MSVVIFGLVASVITQYVASGELFEKLKFKKVQKKIYQLKNHTIVCGYGRNGKQAVIKLKKYKNPVVIIELNDSRIAEIEEDKLLFVKGDATKDETLEKAGIKNAASLISALPSDSDNLYVVLSARQIKKDLIIVSRASDDSSDKKLKIAGADNVIMPDKLGGDHMASLLVTPDVVEFVDMLAVDVENASHVEQILIENLPEEFLLKSIRDLDLRQKTGCSVIGFKTPENKYIINPDANTKLVPGSKLIVLGSLGQIQNLNKIF
jgi:voltage-gated potassium channel